MSYDTRFNLETIDSTTIHHVIGIVAFLGVYAFLLQGMSVGQLYTFGDLAPYYGTRAFGMFTNTWHDYNLGYPYIYNVLPAYLGAITVVGGTVAQNLFYLSLVPAGFLTFFVFAGRFVEPLPARYLAAGLYAINPITIGEFVNGSVAALLGFVGLPLVIHFLYEIVSNDDWFAAVKVAIVFGATTASPWIVFWMVAPFAGYLAYRARNVPRTLMKLVASGILGVLLALPSVHHVIQRAIGLGTESGETVLANALAWNYAEAQPLSVLRLAGNSGLAGMDQLGYNSEPVLAIGLVIPAVALLAWHRAELHVFYAVIGLIVAFMALTRAGVTYPLFEAIPPLWSLRNPVRLQYPLLFSMSILFGAGTATILSGRMPDPRGRSFRRQAIRRGGGLGGGPRAQPNAFLVTAIVALLVFSLFLYTLPAVGALGHDEVRGEDYYVPKVYDEVAAAVDGRILWVPYGYQSQLYLRHTYPDHVGVRSGGVLHGIPNTEYVASLFSDLAAGEPIHERLDDLGVEYVVVDADPPSGYGDGAPRQVMRWGAPWLWGDPVTLAERFDDSERYARVDEVDGFIIYEVDGVTPNERLEERAGFHAIVTQEVPSVERVGHDNLVRNPQFDDGFSEWWVPPETTGRDYDIVQLDNADRAASLTVNATAQRLPIAQAVTVREDHPYELSVAAEGPGAVDLFWYNGEIEGDNLVRHDSFPLATTPVPIVAPTDTVSIRIRPNASSTLQVSDVSLYATTYPSATGIDAAGRVPGLVIDHHQHAHPDATIVAINLDQEAASRFGADILIVDAETVVPGELVFDEAFRQGVGVRPYDNEIPADVPDDARRVTQTVDGEEVIDYWIVGEFDQTPVTVLHTAYHEDWKGSDEGAHFRSEGWANAFTDTSPDEVHWTGDAHRSLVVRIWVVGWIITLGIAGVFVNRRRSGTL